jgi:hypothetical protein
VGCVNGDVVLEEKVEAFVRTSDQPPPSAPEHAMVQQEKVGIGRDCGVNGTAREVDGGCDATNRPVVLELQAVEGVRIIGEAASLEQFVEK